MIAIHSDTADFSKRWIDYCQNKSIEYKVVNCFDNNIIEQLSNCEALFWHHNHRNFQDSLLAKDLLFALEHSGIKVFPDFKTGWHFDDKLAQKYLFEALNIPSVNTYVFYSKKKALNWASNTLYPKVFKLRGGAGSSNVKLVKNIQSNKKLINKAFEKGFHAIDKKGKVIDAFNKYRKGVISFLTLLKTFTSLYILPNQYVKMANNEKGYIYYQDFIPNNDFDIRIIIIDNKAFAIKRMVREEDFRASGSGVILYEKENFDKTLIRLAFDITDKIQSTCCALDFVFLNDTPLVVEISYGFSSKVYDSCVGYWDRQLNFHRESFNPYGWMIESVIKK